MPTQPRTPASQYFEGAGNAHGVVGAEQHLNQVTAAELMRSPPKAVRPSWMVTRFPMSMEEFAQAKEQAAQPATTRVPAAAAAHADSGADAAALGEASAELDRPEDGHAHVSPVPLAPTVGASFDGLGATAWQPPDCACAVGPDHVLLAVNTDLAGYSKTGHQIFRWANMTTLFGKVIPSGAAIFDREWPTTTIRIAGSWLQRPGATAQPDPGC